MKKYLSSVLLLVTVAVAAQTTTTTKPKLVIGIVVDQMRYDYLYRYSEKYGDNGFKRLLREGYSCESTHVNYSPSYTACGHTCVYTGSVPSVHGITGNNWFDLNEHKYVYCTDDSSERTVGSTSKAGWMSPRRMLVTTITDELRLSTNFKSKVIGVALKDRGSILPAGHTANAAYFYDPSSGNWITSTYYMKDLPLWVKEFNDFKLPEKLLKQNWPTLLPIEQYTESHEDNAPFEETYKNESNPVFTHAVSGAENPMVKILPATPYGNSVTLKFAEGAILNEGLGKNTVPDFIAVSLSSTDYIGHRFGPNSVEAEDCYLRLDRELADFFNFLDQQIGAGNYLLFLTADHAGAHVPDFAKRHGIPAGVFPIDSVVKQLAAKLKQQYGDGQWITGYENMQLYLNEELLSEKNVNRNAFVKTVSDFMTQQTGVAKVIDMHNLSNELVEADMKNRISNGYYPKRSGGIYILFEPGWFEGMTKGTTHGTIYAYDTHIPLVWMGWNIKHGEDHSKVNMTDIAPTIAALLHIQEPSGNIGKVIQGVVGK